MCVSYAVRDSACLTEIAAGDGQPEMIAVIPRFRYGYFCVNKHAINDIMMRNFFVPSLISVYGYDCVRPV